MPLSGDTKSRVICHGGLILSALVAGFGRAIKKPCGVSNISTSQHLSNCAISGKVSPVKVERTHDGFARGPANGSDWWH